MFLSFFPPLTPEILSYQQSLHEMSMPVSEACQHLEVIACVGGIEVGGSGDGGRVGVLAKLTK